MKAYIIFLTLLTCSYSNAQDTALFNRIDAIFEEVNRRAATGSFDTLKNTLQNDYPRGTTSTIFLLKQGGVPQKIYIINNASTARETVIFKNGKPVLRQGQFPSSTWNYYFDGETAYLYFKEENRLANTDNSRFNYGVVEGYLSLFKDQMNKAEN